MAKNFYTEHAQRFDDDEGFNSTVPVMWWRVLHRKYWRVETATDSAMCVTDDFGTLVDRKTALPV